MRTKLSTTLEFSVPEFLEDAEDRGAIEESALDALVPEHDLDEEELAAIRAELEDRDVEIVDAGPEGRVPAEHESQTPASTERWRCS